jgi:hypothetical protein
MRDADMSAIEDLERQADGTLNMGVFDQQGGKLSGPAEREWQSARLRSIEVRLSHVMDLVSVLCMRLNVTAEEVGDAHAANSKAREPKGGIA